MFFSLYVFYNFLNSFFRCNCQNLIVFVFNLFEITNKQVIRLDICINWLSMKPLEIKFTAIFIKPLED